MKWKTMPENFGAAWQLLCWVGPPLLWILAFRTFPEFLGANVIKVLEARRSADLERLKGAISLSNSVEIERLKADLQSMSATVKTSADFLTANQSELRGRTINAADTLWEDMLRLRDAYSQLVFIDMILTRDELDKFIRGERDDDGFLGFEKFRGLESSVTKLEADANLGKARLFAGDRLWLIYSNYRTTIAMT